MCSFGLGHLHLYFGKLHRRRGATHVRWQARVRRRKLAARQDAHVEEKASCCRGSASAVRALGCRARPPRQAEDFSFETDMKRKSLPKERRRSDAVR